MNKTTDKSHELITRFQMWLMGIPQEAYIHVLWGIFIFLLGKVIAMVFNLSLEHSTCSIIDIIFGVIVVVAWATWKFFDDKEHPETPFAEKSRRNIMAFLTGSLIAMVLSF